MAAASLTAVLIAVVVAIGIALRFLGEYGFILRPAGSVLKMLSALRPARLKAWITAPADWVRPSTIL